MRSGGQSSPVVIGQPQASATELAAKQAVLFHQVGKNFSFASVEPTGEGEQQKLEGRDVDHSPSLVRANRRRLSDGTVRRRRRCRLRECALLNAVRLLTQS